MRRFAISSVLFFYSFSGLSAQSAAELDALDFEELLNVDVITVSSRKPLTKKQVPGNVTVFNEMEIQNSGARNLIDLLRLVPGLEFGYDVQNGIGLGVRGNWAQEGKALLVIDGLPMNEILFATPGQTFDMPVDLIRQLEVIRGPGASFYGGYAELAVINIKTKASEGYTGAAVSAQGGVLSSGLGTGTLSAMGGWAAGGAFAVASVSTGNYRRGEGLYSDAGGSSFDVYEGNVNRPLLINAHAGYKGLKTQLLFRDDSGTYQDAFTSLPEPLDISHRRVLAQATYDWQINSKWLVTPKISFAYHAPWQTDSTQADSDEDSRYTTRATRSLASILVSGDISKRWNMLTGAEIFQDYGYDNSEGFGFEEDQISSSIRYTNIAFFSQHNITTEFVLLNTGLRFDNNNSFGSALNPWVGLNSTYGKWNGKMLFGYTFRAPSIENVQLSTDGNIEPERSRLFEAEIGYQLSPTVFGSITLFDQKLNRVIVFSAGPDNEEIYQNFGNTGSRGFEAELRYSSIKYGNVNLSYSFFTAAYSQVSFYFVEGQTQDYLGFAHHKLVLNGSYKATKSIAFNPSVVFLSNRDMYVYDDSPADPDFPLKPALQDPTLLVNLNVRKTNLFKNVDAAVSVMDVLNQRYRFIQPYNSFASPLPGTGREVLLSVYWKLN